MAFTYRNKRFGYDNISVGNAAGLERHITGGGGLESTRMEKVATSVSNTNTSVSTQAEKIINTAVTPTSYVSKFMDHPGTGASTS